MSDNILLKKGSDPFKKRGSERVRPLFQQAACRPLNVMFVITSMPVGGAETLLVNLVQRMDRRRVSPSICCLKQPGELGEKIALESPLHSEMIRGKLDLAVIPRLVRLMRTEQIDSVITVGAGDKMFWGRLAARMAGVPIILSALHSTGWPDGVGRLNRMLTPITSGFIAVADSHGEFLRSHERFPAKKVFVIPNGIDTNRFRFSAERRDHYRQKWNIPADAPVVGIVAALRSEKNHQRFLTIAEQVADEVPNPHFVIVGDGPERPAIQARISQLGLADRTRMTGTTDDVPGILSMIDLFALTSDNEASPVSILEAMSCGRPVVAPRVGSISATVIEGKTGYLFNRADTDTAATRWTELLTCPTLAHRIGTQARDHVVTHSSLDIMTQGYENLITRLHAANTHGRVSMPNPAKVEG